jgi:outer membrane immunogenic protein
MKSLLVASVGILALGVASASAADIVRPRPAPAPAPVVAPPFSWTGFYIGINGGGGFGNSEFSAPLSSGSFDTSGGLVGGTLGYNWQTGPWVWGLEGDIDWSNIRGSSGCGIGLTCETRNDWLGTFRGRLGYAIDTFMPYITGGLAAGNIKTTVAGLETDDTRAGWTLGAGLEASFGGPWSAKVEYLYVDLGDADTALGGTADFKANVVRAGLNYRF